jgi:peptidoglycan hydrolase-like protein with peptidoglycan-binding domain
MKVLSRDLPRFFILFFILQALSSQEAFAYCPGFLSRDMHFMSEDLEVKKLQIFLNNKPETQISTQGIGSPGQETNRYAYATQDAVKRFQALNGLPVTGAISLADRLFINLSCKDNHSILPIKTSELDMSLVATPTPFIVSNDDSIIYSTPVATKTVNTYLVTQDELLVPANTSSTQDYLAIYRVVPGKTLEFEGGEDKQEYRDLYTSIKYLIPIDMSDKYISHFKISNKSSDSHQLLATVTPYDRDSDKFVLTILYNNFLNETLEERNLTIVHELAHLLSLNKTWQLATTTCTTFYDSNQFCYQVYSPINQFYQTFWRGVSTQPIYNSNQFVNEYATTNPVEDFAESFAYFVGREAYKLPDFLPAYDSVVSQKLNFFNYFSDFYNLKNNLLNILK